MTYALLTRDSENRIEVKLDGLCNAGGYLEKKKKECDTFGDE
jgi:hypothetical protein